MFWLSHFALASALPAPQTEALEQRTIGSGIAIGAAFRASEAQGIQAQAVPVQGGTRIQLTRELALDPLVSFQLPRAKNWRVGADVALRYYPASIGPVHLVVLGAIAVSHGAVATPAPLEQRYRFLNLDAHGGAGLEWTISTKWALGIQGRYPGASLARHWNDEESAKVSTEARSLQARVEAHRWF